MNSVSVEYTYSDGSAGHARRTSVKYPDGTVLEYRYGDPGSAGDAFVWKKHFSGFGQK